MVDKKLADVTNANCWAHARRDFADAVKAADKKDPSSVRQSVAYQALQKIAEFYNADTGLRPYYYFKYILTELPKLCDERGNIDPTKLAYLMPWSDSLPDECRKPRRS